VIRKQFVPGYGLLHNLNNCTVIEVSGELHCRSSELHRPIKYLILEAGVSGTGYQQLNHAQIAALTGIVQGGVALLTATIH